MLEDKKKANAIKEKKVTGRENFSRTRAIIGVVLIIAAVVLAIILVPIISGRETSYSVLYAKQDIAPGVRITKDNINTYFAGPIEGFDTYKYYKENDVLRSWISLCC